jgi:hypothetical protein
MDIVMNTLLLTSTLLTASALFVNHTRGLIWMLFLQATLLGIQELAVSISHFAAGLPLDALSELLASICELSLGAVVAPAIILLGMNRTANLHDKPIINPRKWILPVLSLVVIAFLACGVIASQLPEQLELLPHAILILAIAVLGTPARHDSLKIIVGINMAENSLIPLTVSGTVLITPFVLGMIIFIDAIFVFITIEAYRDHGELDIRIWRSGS